MTTHYIREGDWNDRGPSRTTCGLWLQPSLATTLFSVSPTCPRCASWKQRFDVVNLEDQQVSE